MGSNYEKTGDRKSRDTLPLKVQTMSLYLYVAVPLWCRLCICTSMVEPMWLYLYGADYVPVPLCSCTSIVDIMELYLYVAVPLWCRLCVSPGGSRRVVSHCLGSRVGGPLPPPPASPVPAHTDQHAAASGALRIMVRKKLTSKLLIVIRAIVVFIYIQKNHDMKIFGNIIPIKVKSYKSGYIFL